MGRNFPATDLKLRNKLNLSNRRVKVERKIEKMVKNKALLNGEVVLLETEKLKPHPLNNEYFPRIKGEEWKFFVESIRKRGFFHTLVVTEDGVILSGHERWRAAKEIGIEKVPCRIVKVDPSSPEAESIILEANLAQRIITPEVYRKCWEGYECVRDNFEDSLIPEFRKAFQKGELPGSFARALSKFSAEEQKNFLTLVNSLLKKPDAEKIKTSTLKKLLEEEKQKIQEFENQIQFKDETIKELKNRIERLRREKEKILQEKEQKEYEAQKLFQRLQEKQQELEDLRLNPSPEIQRKLEQKEEEIQKILKLKQEKENEIEMWKERYQEIKENADNLYEMLEQERKEKKLLKIRFEKELNKKITELKKQEETRIKKMENQYYTPSFSRFSSLLDVLTEVLEEIIGDSDEFLYDQKKILIDKLENLKNLTEEVIGILRNKPVFYNYDELSSDRESNNYENSINNNIDRKDLTEGLIDEVNDSNNENDSEEEDKEPVEILFSEFEEDSESEEENFGEDFDFDDFEGDRNHWHFNY